MPSVGNTRTRRAFTDDDEDVRAGRVFVEVVGVGGYIRYPAARNSAPQRESRIPTKYRNEARGNERAVRARHVCLT